LCLSDKQNRAHNRIARPASNNYWQGEAEGEVGIRGGLEGLKRLSNDEILDKRWQVGYEKISDEWISGEEFFNVVKDRAIFKNNATLT